MSNKSQNATITPVDDAAASDGRKRISIGQEGQRLIAAKLPGPAGEAVLQSAAAILSRGTSPDATTGLVVGYVQSGKTLSFTTVMALARDNGFPIVVVVAGTSTSLLDQSTKRLRRDLQIDVGDGHLRWIVYTNPENNENYYRFLQQSLDDWRDPLVPSHEKRTVLITVMKHHQHLANLYQLLRRLNLAGVPTLVIDDEADQASLNTGAKRGQESTTYRRLLDLRDALPSHTFLQYTATPQAPLLINIIDVLSPRFVEILVPGDGYVGGDIFFGQQHGLVRLIPPQDIPSEANPLSEPPASLLEALMLFLIGVAAGIHQGRSAGNMHRSMFVHPSQKTAPHLEYRVWIGRIFDVWRQLLDLPITDPDRQDLIEDFKAAYAQLLTTVPELPQFEQIEQLLPRAFRQTCIEEVNARGGSTPLIDWGRAYAWILVGGQAMDRGFTIEGLTITYMPRGPGVGNADTLQQRARFFGYKREYLGYCRIYLEQGALTAFEAYVIHEEEMRRQLQEIRDAGTPLVDWKRNFILSPALKPCRANVLQYDYARGDYSASWFSPKVVLARELILQGNRETVNKFINSLRFKPDRGSPEREASTRHEICEGVLLARILEELLIPYRLIAPEDSQEHTGLLLQLAQALERAPGETCTVYKMSPNYSRERGINDSGHVTNLFQGAVPVNPPERRGSIYPGDQKIHGLDSVTVQIHWLRLKEGNNTVASDVPVIAVWVPERLGLSWITQHQPAQRTAK